MLHELLATKYLIPPLRPRLVDRLRLRRALDDCLQPNKRLILITAPAGYGKTTLLVDWVHSLQSAQPGRNVGASPAACWLSLDETDNDLIRFLAYLLSAVEPALREQACEACRFLLVALRSSQIADPQNFLVALLNDLQQQARLVLLILDDYHVIQNEKIHQAVQFLIRNQPSNLRLFVATRSDPPLSLAQLRARDQITEIRMADLMFTSQETAEFLNRCMALQLTGDEIASLEKRTEGWAAGLQLAALAMKTVGLPQPGDRSAFIQNFRSSHQHILEYLADEVFQHQPEAIQTFLLCTSVLNRLCGPLCDAILRRNERQHTASGTWIHFSLPGAFSGQDFLDYLEHNNLFLVPVDAEHKWFRYHTLFADLLRAKLKHTHPGLETVLLKRAAAWNEQQGNLSEAFDQALASGDGPFTVDLFERHILAFFYQSEIMQIHLWLRALPEDLLRSRALLCAVYAAVTALLPPYPPESLLPAECWMQAAEAILASNPAGSTLARAFVLKIRSYWARFREEPGEQVIQWIEEGKALLPPPEDPSSNPDFLRVRSALQTNLGLTYWEMENEPAAYQALTEARRIAYACDDRFNESTAINSLIKMHRLRGQLVEAAALCREALDDFARRGTALRKRVPFSAEIGVQLAEILIEQNQTAGVEALLNENIALGSWTMGHNIVLRGNLALARLAAVHGNLDAALECLCQAEAISKEGAALAGAQRARLWLASQKEHPEFLNKALQWAQEQAWIEFDAGYAPLQWTIACTLARCLLQERAASAARRISLLEWLQRQQRNVQARGWAHWEIELRLVEALLRHQMNDLPGACAALQQALRLAQPGGYLRIFLEEGEPVRQLLGMMKPNAQSLRTYRDQVLGAFFGSRGKQPDLPAALETLQEPLTCREEEVLRFICQGLTNQQIAEQLVVTLNTVKKHNYSIFQKLGVTSRAQAILSARKMGLDDQPTAGSADTARK